MLRAIAGYILGGILNDSPQETIECETREVNDWLVVNMPDNSEDNVDFNSDTESDIDEDEILTCVPMLMTSDEFDDSIYEEREQVEEISRVPNFSMSNELLWKSEDFENIPPHVLLMPESCLSPSKYNTISICDILNNIQYDIMTTTCQEIINVSNVKVSNEFGSRLRLTASPKVKVQERDSHPKDKNPDLSCHSVHMPTYINHRPPATAAKTDLLQQIRELEPAQRAKDVALKKHVTRSQLNRHNKNYIYCSTAKMTRRKDLQRNHSGANNNRKC